MTRHSLLVVLIVISFAVCASPAWATETITRKRDKSIGGDVTAVSKTEVQIKVKAPREETIKVPANEILSIAWTGESPDCAVARADENGGRYQKAIDGYQKSLQAAKTPSPYLKADLEFGIARATAKTALADPTKLDDAVKKLEEFRKNNADHYRLYDAITLLGQLYAAKKDSIKAKLAFDALEKAPWKDYQMTAKIESGRLALAENKLDEAIAEYEAVVAMQPDGPVEESRRNEAVLGKVHVLVSQKKFDEALPLLKDVIDKAPEGDTRGNAEAYLLQGDCLREQGNDSDAVLAYLYVDVLFSSEKPLHAEALYRLATLWDKVGQKGRADEARDRLRSDYENSEWAKQLRGTPTN